jgi:hypothetical protein
MKDEVKCCVCERKFEQPTPKKVVKPAPPFICGDVCARQYNRVLLVKALSHGAN